MWLDLTGFFAYFLMLPGLLIDKIVCFPEIGKAGLAA